MKRGIRLNVGWPTAGVRVGMAMILWDDGYFLLA